MEKKERWEVQENEWNIVEVIQKLWNKRKFIIKVTLVGLLFGMLIALWSKKEYTAHCIIVPQLGEKGNTGNLGSLAVVAGIHLGGMGSTELLSPKIYPKILFSVPFQKELMYDSLSFDDYEHPVSIIDFYTHEDYQTSSFVETLWNYTLGVPAMLIKAIRKEESESVSKNSVDTLIHTLSEKEYRCMRVLQNTINLNVNEKEGILTLSAKMPEAIAAAQLVAVIQQMLQRYVTEFKIEKAQVKLQFIEERYEDAKKSFENKQKELAAFRDANRNVASAIAKTVEERLSNEYAVALSVYSELAKQREQAGIQVKEDTPIFTIVEPVTVPLERSKPKRTFILLAFTCLGGLVGIGLVFLMPYVAEISGNLYLKTIWKREMEE